MQIGYKIRLHAEINFLYENKILLLADQAANYQVVFHPPKISKNF
jgi:hypothetical protein